MSLSCKDTAKQVLMSVCPWSFLNSKVPEGSGKFPVVQRRFLNAQGRLREGSGKVQGRYKEDSRNA